MQPPYTITPEILQLVSDVSQRMGAVNASFLTRQSPELRKRNRIKTIQASLAVEGNTLSVNQVTAIIENKRVLGPAKDIREVENAIEVYGNLGKFKPLRERSLLAAHRLLLRGLLTDAGRYRSKGAGIVKGKQLTHLAPPAANIPGLMKDLFRYLEKAKDPLLIKSCVFHYELEFIHPFTDGNGRMGRLWQTLLLMNEFPAAEFLPFETLIGKKQQQYYKALAASDKKGTSTPFIHFMLTILREALDELLQERAGPVLPVDRIRQFLSLKLKSFTRKDYMIYFKAISAATASRDLQTAVKDKLLVKKGDKNKTVYRIR